MFLFDKLDIFQGEFISYALVRSLALQVRHDNLCSNSCSSFFPSDPEVSLHFLELVNKHKHAYTLF